MFICFCFASTVSQLFLSNSAMKFYFTIKLVCAVNEDTSSAFKRMSVPSNLLNLPTFVNR